jgi:hypothetical protein
MVAGGRGDGRWWAGCSPAGSNCLIARGHSAEQCSHDLGDNERSISEDALALRMDGQTAAASTVSRKRAIFYNALEYAVELGHLPANPILSIKWRAPKTTEAVDPGG